MIDIKVLGTGCPNFHKLEAMCHEVVDELGIVAHIESITYLDKFMD
ncbi:MAG TPA: hypothetical protein ENN49_08625 [Bacteroidales bacterium]|nr:hypothetical protein [Bacteroidales bacterium]